MKLSIILFFLLIGLSLIAQTDSIFVKEDSISKIVVSPYFKRDDSAFSNYIVLINSKELLKFGNGIDMINSLRGYFPGLSTNPYAPNSINHSETMIIDGIPLNGILNANMSLNSFDYSTIAATRSGNLLTIFDQPANNGAIILESKKGKDIVRPLLEFNSFNTHGFYKPTGSDQINDFHYSQALSYSQDFGKVDTRVSYNLLSNHSSLYNQSVNYPDPHFHRLKMNTGFEATRNLRFRLILDGSHIRHESSDSIFFSGRPDAFYENKSRRNFYHINLTTEYQPLSWLTLNGQLYYGNMVRKIHNKYSTPALTSNEIDFKLFLTTLSLLVNKTITKGISTRTTAGFTFRNSNKEANIRNESPSSFSYLQSQLEVGSQSLWANSLVSFNNLVFLEGSWNSIFSNHFPTSDNQKNYYSISGSGFLIKNKGHIYIVKARASVGKSYQNPYQKYPYDNQPTSLQQPYELTKKELGLDLGFLESKFDLTINYFNQKSENIYTTSSLPSSPGFTTVYINIGSRNTNGYEVIAGYNLLPNNPSFSFKSRLIWTQYQTEIGSTQNSGGNTLGSPYPDWTGSIWNMINWKNLSGLLIIETSQGGIYYTFPGMVVDMSWTKLRDVSIGYAISNSFLSRLRISDCFISVTGRNLLSSINQDKYPEQAGGLLQKSISLQLNLSF